MFYRSSISRPATLTDLQIERLTTVEELRKKICELHPVVEDCFQQHRAATQARTSSEKLPNFDLGDYVLVPRDDFHSCEKNVLRWRGPHCVQKAVNDCVNTVEDLRTGALKDVHIFWLKFFRDSELNQRAIMSHVISSETSMVVAHLMGIEKTPSGL